jgi:hypothetical protein
MARISFFTDVQIHVIFPFFTKSLSSTQRERVITTGSFPYVPKPQVESVEATSASLNLPRELSIDERVASLKSNFDEMLERLRKIKKATQRRAKNVVFEYDPLLTNNEAYADAEETLFGFASGTITYAMYESILDFEKKVDKWIGYDAMIKAGSANG